MLDEAPIPDPLIALLKRFIVSSLELRDLKADTITDDEPLLGGRIGLDPLDAVELATCLEDRFGIAIRSQNEIHAAFANVAGLADYIRNYKPANPVVRQTLLPFEMSARW